jgi:hypothetical protein
MAAQTVNDLVARLTQPGPLEAARFETLLGANLTAAPDNPAWSFYTFELPGGPFAGGELRLNKNKPAALLILTPREPNSLTQAQLDTAAWGPRVSFRPNPHIPPEGADTYTYQVDGVNVSAQWHSASRRLRHLVLVWREPSLVGRTPPPNGGPARGGRAGARGRVTPFRRR